MGWLDDPYEAASDLVDDAFDIAEDVVDSSVDVATNLVSGELSSRDAIIALINAGMTIYAISEATGIAEDVLNELVKD